MSHDLIRFIDRSLGTLLCLLLTLLRRLSDLFGGRRRREPRRILFIKLIEQGATVLAYGALRRAASKVGRENVFFCVFAENRPILDVLDVVPPQNVIEIRNQGFATFLLDAVAAMARCRREGIDTTIDLEGMARAPAILAYLTGAGRRVGLHRFTSEAPYRGDLMTDRVQYNPHLHTAMQYVALVEALDAPPGETPLPKLPLARIEAPNPRFTPLPAERQQLEELIAAEAGGPVAAPIVLLNPNASDLLPLRRWDAERFVELGRRLLAERRDVTLAITGGPGEHAAAEQLVTAIGRPPRVLSLAGKTSLRELLVLYTLADVLVTNDSGPGHFASMTDIHNVVLFGPETPLLWGPRGGRPHVIWARLACSPCVNVLNHNFSPCTDNLCMQSIGVEAVYREVLGCLEQGHDGERPSRVLGPSEMAEV